MQMAYKAYDPKGGVIRGFVDGENQREILQSMKQRGLRIVQLTPASQGLGGIQSKLQSFFPAVKNEELIVFTRQFHTLFKAGLSMDILLSTLTKQTQNKQLQQALMSIQGDIQSGTSLAKAFSKHPRIFDKLYTSMLLAGEEAGILEQVLGELVNVLEKDDKLKREVSSATLYPKIVVGVMCMALYVMLTFVIPKFAAFYDKFQAQLPLPTRILMAGSDFASNYWYVVLVLLVFVVWTFKRWVNSPRGRLKWDLQKLRFPVFGNLFQKISMARFGHLFAALYRSGLPLVRSFEVLSQVIGNEAYAREISRFREGLLKGKTIAEVMRQSKLFSVIMIETTAIGEQSGNLDNMLSAMASHFDLEISHITKNLTTLLEPILLCMMFGMVTLMALGIFLPMWNMSKAVMGH